MINKSRTLRPDWPTPYVPLSCTYTITEQPNLIYIITTIIGLFGGLNVALKVIVPALVKIENILSDIIDGELNL
jgi:hypothetical protein